MSAQLTTEKPIWRYETREVNHSDGSLEIVRILNDDMLGHWTPNGPLAFEKSVVWLQPITELDFVRTAWVRNAQSRRGPLLVRGVGMVLGYAKLTADAPRDCNTKNYTRRLFYLTEDDLQLNLNQIPPGVYDPKSILPGIMGKAPTLKDLDRGYPAWVGRSDSVPPVAVPTPAVS
jgi:hypothetical protein